MRPLLVVSFLVLLEAGVAVRNSNIMRNIMRKPLKVISGLLIAMSCSMPGIAYGVAINLTDQMIVEDDGDIITESIISTPLGDYHAAFINDAIYRRPGAADTVNSGSGIFRDLYTSTGGSSTSDKQEGYNRHDIMDSHIPGGFDPNITVGDLIADNTGNYYVFVVDSNEPGGGGNESISLDDFKIHIGSDTDPVSLPQDEVGLDASFGSPIYDMNLGGMQNHILLDSSIFSGSGQMDLFIFVPQSLFAGANDTDLVYVYTEFGGYTEASGFDAASGPEQVSIPGKTLESPVSPIVPEPHSAVLMSFGCLLLGLRRRRG